MRLCISFVLGLALIFPAQAQLPRSALDIVTWEVQADPATVQPGESLRLVFQANIHDASSDALWKMYALDSPLPSRAVSITFDTLPEGIWQQGEFRQTGAQEGFDEWFNSNVVFFEESTELWADFVVRTDQAPGVLKVRGLIEFMICTDGLCLPPTKVPFETKLEVTESRQGEAFDSVFARDLSTKLPDVQVPAVVDPPAPAADIGDEGLWAFLFLAIGAGIGAFLMPCVYPMIPLTVSYFTKHAERLSESVRMSLVYGLAIVSTFTGLGVAMAALVKGAGAQSIAASPWVNLSIGIVFIVFALSLLGLFQLRLPSRLVNYVNKQGRGTNGYIGAFFMGFTLTLVSFTCTVPFVGLLLPAIAGGAWFYPVLGMLVFSLTFSMPFMLFALFPRALQSLPNSGSWMHVLQVVFGFIELAAALKFLSNADIVWGLGLISRPLAIAMCIVIAMLTGFYLIGKLWLKGAEETEPVGVGRLVASMVFFGLALYLLPGLLGAPLNRLDAYLPPRQSDDVSLIALFGNRFPSQDEGWITDDPGKAFAEAASADRLVMIDFTGYTCTNCREMEANVFTQLEIAHRFEESFVLLRLYTDGPRDMELQQYQLDLTGTVALPTYAIVDPLSQDTPIIQISGVVSPQRFAAFLDQGLVLLGS